MIMVLWVTLLRIWVKPWVSVVVCFFVSLGSNHQALPAAALCPSCSDTDSLLSLCD